MREDTDIGGPRRGFPATVYSMVERVASSDADVRQQAYGELVTAYWKPAYVRFRLRWGVNGEDAKDLTQEFFARAMERGFFADFDPTRARFRTFFRTCLDRFAQNASREAQRQKRGGAAQLLPLDFAGAERDYLAAGQVATADVDQRFQDEWVRGLFSHAAEALRASTLGGSYEVRFRLFERYDLAPGTRGDRLSYQLLATEFGLPLTQVTNHLAWARKEFRRLLLDRLRALTANDAEFRAEAAELLGVRLP
ncbi:MAG: sigma factor [Gemmatimonadota bacterium]